MTWGLLGWASAGFVAGWLVGMFSRLQELDRLQRDALDVLKEYGEKKGRAP